MGKPGKAFFDQVVASTNCAPENCLMVGDDLDGDIVGAIEAGLQACLVQTGKFKASDKEALPDNASCIASIAELPKQLGI